MMSVYSKYFLDALDQTIVTDFSGVFLASDVLTELLPIFRYVKNARRRLYFIGNGGSAGIAMHMTADFLKNGGIVTSSMHEPATLTCLANDFGYEQVFSRQVGLVAEAGDLLVAISSSGNSPNVLLAVEKAKARACQVMTFTGFRPDNRLRQMGDLNVYVPSVDYGIVESVHNYYLQQVVDKLVDLDGVGMEE